MSRPSWHMSDAFYEWLLSDHPDARAERDARRNASYQHQQESSAKVAAWAANINAAPAAPQSMRDLAASMGPRAAANLQRAEAAYEEPDESYVARLRSQHETFQRASGAVEAHNYQYPQHLTGPLAAGYPRPPETETEAGL